MKFKILIFLTLIIIPAVSYFAIVASKKSAEIQNPVPENNKENLENNKKQFSVKTKEYSDPAGFKFSYPEELKPEVKIKENQDYYSSLQLADKNKIGLLRIDATSTKYQTIDEWIKNNKELSDKSEKIKLADLNGIKIVSKDKIIYVAIDIDVLFTITATFPVSESEYWEKASEKIVSSFDFEQPDSVSVNTDTSAADEDIVFEGEEVIE